MPRDYGLAALSGILGGIGEGGYKGYVSGMDDAHKAALLAEQVRHSTTAEGLTGRQLDQQQEAMFVDVPGAGRVRKELAPYMLEKATQGADREREAGRAKSFGEVLLGLDNPEMQTLGQILHRGGMSSGDAAKIYGAGAKPPAESKMQGWQWQDVVTNRALDEAASEKRGESPGTRSRDYMNLNKPVIAVPNLGPLTRTEALNAPHANIPPGPPAPGAAPQAPRGPEPIVRVDTPLTGEVTEKLSGAARLTSAVTELEKTLDDPEVDKYMGPIGQWRSTAQRYTPGALAGKVPPVATNFEGNLAIMTNYTIKLITGAQMGELEATRIRKELPSALMQPEEFRNRLEMTKRNIEIGKRALFAMALTGNQRQKATAMGIAAELGLDIPSAVSAPRNAPAAAPQATPQAPRQYEEGKRLYSPSRARWGVIRNGEWVPE